MLMTPEDLRRFTVARNFLKPTTLKRALHRMGFVQADPIRAPARAQDLILRHRVKDYCAGDLERRYAALDIDEDVLVNYGFVTSALQALMHPREKVGAAAMGEGAKRKADVAKTKLLLEFVRARGEVHPREVEAHFSHGRVQNYWGGSSNATTHLLEAMQYRGLLRVARREKGIRVYAAHQHGSTAIDATERRARIDALVEVVVRIYAPLPSASLAYYVRRLRYAVPQWQSELTAALERVKERLSYASVDGRDWFWLGEEEVSGFKFQVSGFTRTSGRTVTHLADFDRVRLLAPFDPVVHDRARFEMLWGWAYRFEAYTPAVKRKLGYYALPLLWRDQVIGWGNLSVKNGTLESDFGFAGQQPRDRAFNRELKAELDRMRAFLGLDS